MKRLRGKAAHVPISVSMAGDNRHLLDMLQRREVGRLLLATAAECLVTNGASAVGAAPALVQLFSVARSKNANIVRYSARCLPDGLDVSQPIDAYWVMLAEDGRREELSWAERKLAYGFSVSDVATTGCRLQLLAFKARRLTVRRRPEGFRALLDIAGRRGWLERIFVQTSESGLLPSVRYLDVHGKSLDGETLFERIVPR